MFKLNLNETLWLGWVVYGVFHNPEWWPERANCKFENSNNFMGLDLYWILVHVFATLGLCLVGLAKSNRGTEAK